MRLTVWTQTEIEIPDEEVRKISNYIRRRAGMKKNEAILEGAILYEAQRRKIKGVPPDAIAQDDIKG